MVTSVTSQNIIIKGDLCCDSGLRAVSPGLEPGEPAPLAGRRQPPAGATPSGVASASTCRVVSFVCVCVCGVGDRAPLVASGGVASLRRVCAGEACSACVIRAALFATTTLRPCADA